MRPASITPSKVKIFMRPTSIVIPIFFLAALAGCDEPVETPSLTGEWTGTTRDGNDAWTFNFDEPPNPGDVTGTVVLGEPQLASGTISGTYDHPAVTLGLRVTVDGVTPPVEHPAEYYGTVDEGRNLIEGTMVIEERTYTLNLSRTR